MSGEEFRKRSINGYELLNIIGEGEFGKVVKAKNNKGLSFAIKVIPKSSIARNPKLQSSLSTETSILLKLNHPNIIEFVEEFEDEGNLFIVYEYCDRGNLRAYTQAHGALSERASVYIFKEILSALVELERCGIIHRDLKPENILLKDTKVKLADFGLSSEIGIKHNSLVGSPMFMAPEAMKNFDYTIKGDIYSLGVTLFKTATAKYPFYDEYYENLLNLKYEFSETSIPRDLSPQLRSLIWNCLQVDPNNRPSIHELLSYIRVHFGDLDGLSIEEDIKRKRGFGRGTSANRGHSLAAPLSHNKPQPPWSRAPHFALNDSFQVDASSRKALNTSVQDNYNSSKIPSYPPSGRVTSNPYAPLNGVRDQAFVEKTEERGRGRTFQPTHKPSTSLIPRENPLLKPYDSLPTESSFIGNANLGPDHHQGGQLRNIHVQLPEDDNRQIFPSQEEYNPMQHVQQTQSPPNVFANKMPIQNQPQLLQPQLNPQLNLSVMNFELERVNTQERYQNTQPSQNMGPAIKRGYNPLLHQADGNRRGSNPTQLAQRNYGSIVPQQIVPPQGYQNQGPADLQLQSPLSPNRTHKPLQIRGTPAMGRQTILQNFASGQHHHFKEYSTFDDQNFQQRVFGQDSSRYQSTFDQKLPYGSESSPNYGHGYPGQLQLQTAPPPQQQYYLPNNVQPVAMPPGNQQFNPLGRPVAYLERESPMPTGSGSPFAGSFINNTGPLVPAPQVMNVSQQPQYATYQAPMLPNQQAIAPFGFATREEGSTSSSKGYKHPLMGNYFSNQSKLYPSSPGPLWGT